MNEVSLPVLTLFPPNAQLPCLLLPSVLAISVTVELLYNYRIVVVVGNIALTGLEVPSMLELYFQLILNDF